MCGFSYFCAVMTIYNQSGQQYDIVVNDDSDRQDELMGHDRLTLRFSLAVSITFEPRCYCTWEGRKYIMFSQPEVTKKHSRQFDYVLTMYTSEYMLGITAMRDINYNESTTQYEGGSNTKFPLTATPRQHLQMIADNLNKADGTRLWRVDYSRTIGMVQESGGAYVNYDGQHYSDTPDDMRLVSYERMYCSDALRQLADTFDTEFEVEEKTVGGTTYHLLCLHKVEYNKSNPLQMSYGDGNGFDSGIARRNETETPPLDRLYVQGGEQNIPVHYGQTETATDTWTGEKSNTLMLPANVDDIRYDGGHLYMRVDIDGTAKKFYLDNVLRYSYGLYSAMLRYKDEVTGNFVANFDSIFVSDFQHEDGYRKEADGWKVYAIDSDRRSIYRAAIGNNNTIVPYRSTNVEGFYDGTEVYPMRVGAVSAVQQVDNEGNQLTTITEDTQVFYDIFDNDPALVGGNLDYKELGVPGETMTVIFQDGMLAGREFNIQTIGDGNDAKPNCAVKTVSGVSFYCIPLCQSEQDGVVMPGDVFIPAIGNHYIVFHCQLPEAYVTDAEIRLLWQSVDNLYHHDEESYSFSGSVDDMWVKDNWDAVLSPATVAVSTFMAIGQYIKITDGDLFGSAGQTMRVTNVKQRVNDKYNIELSLTNAPQPVFNWAKRLASTVREVNVRPPFWHPWNRHLPPPINGVRISRQVSSFFDNTTNVLSSRRMSLLPTINDSVDALGRSQNYFQQCRNAINDIRIALLNGNEYSTFRSALVDTHTGISKITDIGNGDGSCSAITQKCTPSTLDIIVPKEIR